MNQTSLVSAITKEIERQKVFIDVGALNKIIDCANQIIAEIERKRIYADCKMSFIAWFGSDDTGASSKWLASILSGNKPSSVAYPYDPSDFVRCYRMLNCVDGAKELFEIQKDLISSKCNVWRNYLENWNDLEKLWEQESPNNKCPKLYELMQKLQSVVA